MIWTFRINQYKYYEMTSDITSFESDDDSPKKQLDKLNVVPTAKIYWK